MPSPLRFFSSAKRTGLFRPPAQGAVLGHTELYLYPLKATVNLRLPSCRLPVINLSAVVAVGQVSVLGSATN